jgi:hypothetical protein
MGLNFEQAISYLWREPNYIVKILIGGGIILVGFLVNVMIGLVGGAGSLFASVGVGSTGGASAISFAAGLAGTVVSALFLIPILGYGVQVMRNVMNGYQAVTPEWSDFSQLATDGAKAWVCYAVLFLPAFLLSQFGSLLGVVNSSAGLIGACASCLALPLGFLALVLMPAVFGRYAATGDIAQSLNFSAVFATVQQNPGLYLLLAVVQIGIFIAGAIVGAIACLIGIPFAFFIAYLVQFHLYGQAQLIAQGGTSQPAYGANTPYGGPRPF